MGFIYREGRAGGGEERELNTQTGDYRVPHNQGLPGWAVKVVWCPPALCRTKPSTLTIRHHPRHALCTRVYKEDTAEGSRNIAR